ncbi:G-protein gamma subunit [Halteromyces radiatus]|uniref:G-protein gamma subunit n=1 Tax=Halteromyces radiatus TaxID=101107 RepID=UPI00221E9036|nr:G-protein gamma subunit [Halteromyces radiatus]KAI8089194.1 G-protein gamma subunit [Halteromyces radiatus]
MSNYKRLQISESKLNHILEYNKKLAEQLEMPCISVSEASESMIRYCNSTKDPFLPSIWGKLDSEDDPFAPVSKGCCNII